MSKADCAHCDHKCSHAPFNPQYCPFEDESQEEYEKQKRLEHFDKLTAKAKARFHGK